MKRYAQMIRLRPEAEAEYVRYHAAVWPTVLQTIAGCGIRNYSIFLRNGVLFAYFEYHGTDYDADMRKMAADPETQRWWSIMDPMQSPWEMHSQAKNGLWPAKSSTSTARLLEKVPDQ